MATVGISGLEGPFAKTEVIGPVSSCAYDLQKTVTTLSSMRSQH